jgi:hypothetical protein
MTDKQTCCECETCKTLMVNRGESANLDLVVIECPTCGTAKLCSKAELEKLCSSCPSACH